MLKQRAPRLPGQNRSGLRHSPCQPHLRHLRGRVEGSSRLHLTHLTGARREMPPMAAAQAIAVPSSAPTATSVG